LILKISIQNGTGRVEMLGSPKRILFALLSVCMVSAWASSAFLVGDFNRDCRVDIADLSLLAQQWLFPPPLCVEQGLVGHWKLDEDRDLSANDSSGNNLTGVVNGSAMWQPGQGQVGGAIRLDGVDDHIQITDYKGISGSAPRSCTAWIRTTHTNVQIITWGTNSPGGAWRFGINDKGLLRLDVNGGYAVGSSYINDDMWHHVGVACGVTDANSVRLFVDGILDTISDSKSQKISTVDGADVKFGAPLGSGPYFKGMLDDVRIYDRALTTGQMWALAFTNTTDTACRDIFNIDGVNLRDFAVMAVNWLSELPPVVINEFMADNDATLAAEVKNEATGKVETVYPAWIELYNQSGYDVDISGWYLTDNEDDLTKWPFPEGTVLESDRYLVVFASSKKEADYPDNYPYVDVNGYLHTNFNLRNDGEYLALVQPIPTTGDPDRVRIVHEYYTYRFDDNPIRFGYPPQDGDISYGMFYNQQRYFAIPTPGKENNGSFLGYVADTKFSHDRGFYDGRIDVAITSKTDGATIRYTLDGSEPTEDDKGITYKEPIIIDKTTTLRAMAYKPGWVNGNVDTHTYIFAADVITQSPKGDKPAAGWPEPGSGINNQDIDYGMDPDIVGDPEYAGIVDDALLSLPAISIVTDLGNLFDKSKGIYVNARRHGMEWERPASIELLNPDGSKGLHINAGIRIRGGYSRSAGNPKHAFRLFFRGSYGSPRLDFPLFGDEGVETFDKVDLRTAQNYSWSFGGDSRNTMCREIFSRDMQRDMNQPYTRSRYYHLYLNGQYWGLFQTQERAEARFASSYFGGDVEDYDVVKITGGNDSTAPWYEVEATDGNADAFERLWEACNKGFAKDAAYYAVQGLNPDKTPNPGYERLVDVDNLIDYMISTFYVGDADSPISSFLGNDKPNNVYAIFNRQNPDGFKYFRHDAEHSLGVAERTNDRTGPYPAGYEFRYFNPQWLHQKLAANAEYRTRFGDRVHRYFFNNGLLTPEQATASFLERADQIDSAIVAESARWGDSKREPPFTKEDWSNEINRVVEYFRTRTGIVLGQLQVRSKKWYPPVTAPTFFINDSYSHGGHVGDEDLISMTVPEGRIFYTLDGSDPRLGENEVRVTTTVLVREGDVKTVHVPTGPDDGFADAPIPDIGHWKFDDNFLDASGNGNEGMPYGNAALAAAFVNNRYDQPRKALSFDGMDDYVYIPPPWETEIFDLTKDITLACWVKYSTHYDRAGLITKGISAWDLSLADGSEGKISFHLEGVGDVVSDDTYDDDQWHHAAAVRNRDKMTLYIDGEEDASATVDPNDLIAINTSLVFIGSNYELWWDDDIGAPKPDRVSYKGLIDDARIYSIALTPAEIKRVQKEGEFWPRPGYDDSAWTMGTSGVGFYESAPDDYEQYIGINIEDQMLNENSTCCIRIPFTVSDPEKLVNMTLRIRADDGFVAYLNGEEIARDNLEGTPQWNSTSKTEIPDETAIQLRDFDVSAHKRLLKQGANILGILGVNRSASNTDFLISAELAAGENVNLSESAILYEEPFTVDKSTLVRARTLGDSGEISALNEAVFDVGPVADSLRITEIMYHPSDEGISEPNSEYIELANISEESVNLNLVSFTDGIRFTFGDVELDAGAHCLVVRKWSHFAELYPDSNDLVIGQYSGSLDNAGEKVRLADAFGRTIHEFKYADGWYDITDDGGFSLTVRNGTWPAMDILNQNLVAYWKLDERASTIAADSTANGHHGTIFGDAIYRPIDGRVDGAILLDGIDDYVEFADFTGVTGSRDRTCSAWIKTKTGGEILAWGTASSGAKWLIEIDESGLLNVDTGGGSVVGSTVLGDNKWHHIAVVSETGNTSGLKLYVDGRAEPPSHVSSQSISTAASADVSIGVFGSSERYFAGLVDDVGIYNTALDRKAIDLLHRWHRILDDKASWRPSSYVSGSPGYDDPVYGKVGYIPEPGDIKINEVLAHSDTDPPSDFIELYNTTDHAISIGGWFISDDADDYRKFQIPSGTTIPAGGFKVFDEFQHFGNADHPGCKTPFALSENGETVYIRSNLDGAGNMTGFCEQESFGASEANISFGRYYKQSTNTYNFVAMVSQTSGYANALPKVEPVAINEIMYNPTSGGAYDHNEYEYIELLNSSSVAVPLYEWDNLNKRYVPWRFTDGIDFEFPLGTVLPGGQRLLIVRNPVAFEERYGDTGLVVLGPYDGRLDNAGEKLTLSKPADEVNDEYYYIRVDQVSYGNSPPWPTEPNGKGSSLSRIDPTAYGNDVVNWQVKSTPPGQ
jgi:hypothetical protein